MKWVTGVGLEGFPVCVNPFEIPSIWWEIDVWVIDRKSSDC